MKNIFYLLFVAIIFASCIENHQKNKTGMEDKNTKENTHGVSVLILGTIQDGGSPHPGCNKSCCKDLFDNPDKSRKVVSLGIIDHDNNLKYLFEATPDMPGQMKMLKKSGKESEKEMPDGIFLTHAHTGHYTGLMYLGKEAMDTKNMPVYTMPRMKKFLENNGPWDQLVNNKNIVLNPLTDDQKVKLTSNITVTPITVPHRDEYSETVGFIIEGPSKKVLFIPDVDKWEKWDKNIIDVIAGVDFAFIDGTFYDGEEINKQNIAEIPHPFIIESMNLFKELPPKEKNKIYFIHLNHTNPALDPASKQSKTIIKNGFHVARMNQIIKL